MSSFLPYANAHVRVPAEKEEKGEDEVILFSFP